MDQAPLAQRARKAGLDRADQSEHAFGDDQERIEQAPALEIVEKRRTARCVLFGARREMEQDLLPVLGECPMRRGPLPAATRRATAPRRLERICISSARLRTALCR